MFKSLFKNRLVLFIISILLCAGFILLSTSLFSAKGKTTTIVVVSEAIKKGEQISADKLTTQEVGSYNLPETVVTETNKIEGKFALTDFSPNEYVLAEQTANELSNSEKAMTQLDGSRILISVNVKDFARALSDKLIAGDIVSAIITTEENGTILPGELNYVEVFATTTNSGLDKEQAAQTMEENLATVTLLVTPYQAQLFAEYDKKAEIHFALVYRGEKETAQKFLDAQAKVLSESTQEPVNITPPQTTPQEENKNVKTDSNNG